MPKEVQPQVEPTTPKQENEKFNKELLQIWKEEYLMKTIPVREGYTNGEFIVFYSDIYKILDKNYHLVFIADMNKTIFDIALYPLEDVKRELFSITICGEHFTLLK